jgi:hypothetical protein
MRRSVASIGTESPATSASVLSTQTTSACSAASSNTPRRRSDSSRRVRSRHAESVQASTGNSRPRSRR